MATTLTPTSPPTFPAALSTPADGDACNAASVNVAYQALLDAVAAAQAMTARGLSIKPRLRCVNGTSVVMSAVPAMAVTVGTVLTVKNPIPAQTFTVADLEGGGAFSADTYYFMYLYLSGGLITRQISATAPDAYNMYKASSTDYAYVGSFRVGPAGTITNFVAMNGVYRRDDVMFTTFSGVGPSTINLLSVGLLPASARVVVGSLVGNYSTSTTADITLVLLPEDGGTNFATRVLQKECKDGAGNTARQPDPGAEIYVDTDSSYRIRIFASAANYEHPSGGGNAILWGLGYVEH